MCRADVPYGRTRGRLGMLPQMPSLQQALDRAHSQLAESEHSCNAVLTGSDVALQYQNGSTHREACEHTAKSSGAINEADTQLSRMVELADGWECCPRCHHFSKHLIGHIRNSQNLNILAMLC
eukprot:TRINITY_DN6830_c0_g2_i1.p1 TRINITY_DN6830_c0_g2~~TRINITY_DN6830_c0_g2_i1.p1  ORF type:complete len:123 (-),score=6.25 TRINITY_DN6830_c0_g2_i1:129-497(-)